MQRDAPGMVGPRREVSSGRSQGPVPWPWQELTSTGAWWGGGSGGLLTLVPQPPMVTGHGASGEALDRTAWLP